MREWAQSMRAHQHPAAKRVRHGGGPIAWAIRATRGPSSRQMLKWIRGLSSQSTLGAWDLGSCLQL